MNLEIRVDHLGESQFEIHARNHTILSDQPAESGGYDEGMMPTELLLASLGSCAGYYAAQYLRQNQLAAQGTSIRVTADKLKNPARLDNFVIDLNVPADLAPRHQEALRRAIEKCPVHNTMTHTPSISLEIHSSQGVVLSPALVA